MERRANNNFAIKGLSFFLFPCFLLLALLALENPIGIGINHKVIAFIILVLGLVPTALFLKRKMQGTFFLPAYSLIYVAYYAVPVFVLKQFTLGYASQEFLPNQALEKALLLSLLGLIALLVGYYSELGRFFTCFLPKLKLNWDNSRAEKLSMLFGVLGLIAPVLSSKLGGYPKYGQAMNLIVFCSDLIPAGVLLILQLQHKLGKGGKIFLWGALVPIRIALGLAQGALAQAIFLPFFLALIYVSWKKSISWKTILICSLALMLFFPFNAVKSSFRQALSQQDLSFSKKVVLFLEKASQSISDLSSYGAFFEKGVFRISQLHIFARAVEYTPQKIPYWGKEFYYPNFFYTLPRFLYEEKPMGRFSNRFGRTYGLIGENNFTTAVGAVEPINLYISFGWAGVVAGMFLVGALCKTIDLLCVFSGNRAEELFVGVFILVHLIFANPTFTYVLGNVFWDSIILFLFMFLISKKERNKCLSH